MASSKSVSPSKDAGVALRSTGRISLAAEQSAEAQKAELGLRRSGKNPPPIIPGSGASPFLMMSAPTAAASSASTLKDTSSLAASSSSSSSSSSSGAWTPGESARDDEYTDSNSTSGGGDDDDDDDDEYYDKARSGDASGELRYDGEAEEGDAHRRRVNSYFSKEQEEEFERIFQREVEAGAKLTRQELRETARALKIPPGGELKLFRWFENRRAWMKQRTKRQNREASRRVADGAAASGTASPSTVKRRRLAHAQQPLPLYIVDLTMPIVVGHGLTVDNQQLPYERTSMIQSPSDALGSAAAPQMRVSAVALHTTNVGSVLTTSLLVEPSGRGVADLPLKSVVCPGVLVDCAEYLSKKREHGHPMPNAIDCDAFPAELNVAEKALVLHTGFHQVTSAQPFITETAAKILSEKRVALVAIDCSSVDPVKPGSSVPPAAPGPSKLLLLRNRVAVLENLAHVDELLATLNSTLSGFTLHAAPLPIPEVAAMPVRAYAVLI